MATGASATGQADGHHADAHSVCPDCGAPAQGKFCVDCGQEIHVHRTLFHLGHELLHGIMHFDGRFWRTLPLLVSNPGKLTREWIMGKRTRYVSPLAMFLCTLFVMFMALSFAPPPSNVVVNLPNQIAHEKELLAEAEKAVTEAQATIDGATDGATAGVAAGKMASASMRAQTARERVATLETEAREGRKDGLKAGSWQAQVADLKFDDADKPHSLSGSVEKKLKNPDLALYKLQQTTYKFAFLLVPLSIPFMALIFLWRRQYTLYDHGVFVLYSLTFMAVLLMVAMILRTVFPSMSNIVSGLCMAIAPVHIFAQLKGTYNLGVWGALWRTMVLGVFCTIVISFFIIAIIYLGLGH
ncbi:DUF3667 domain-containing protein [Brevundimonas sp.]|uniref:DUF3667 domain-containing protein n=1 Tax=Brevundimonas sp. TaxID=1871086 RepID=UPI002FC5E9A0